MIKPLSVKFRRGKSHTIFEHYFDTAAGMTLYFKDEVLLTSHGKFLFARNFSSRIRRHPRVTPSTRGCMATEALKDSWMTWAFPCLCFLVIPEQFRAIISRCSLGVTGHFNASAGQGKRPRGIASRRRKRLSPISVQRFARLDCLFSA